MNLIKRIIFVIFILNATASFASQSNSISIKIVGLEGAPLENALQRLTIAKDALGASPSEQKIKNFYYSAAQNIKDAISPFGYFKATIKSNLQHISPFNWFAYFIVKPGPRLRIASVDLQISGPGSDDPALLKLYRDFPIQKGQVFQAKKYETAKENLFQTAIEKGYLKAVIDEKQVQIDLTNYSAKIVLHLNTGPGFYFGEVHFKQNTFDEGFLRRYMSFHEGEPFSTEKLMQFQQNLSKSHYFDTIAVDPNLQAPSGHQIPINVSLVPNKAKQFDLGIGYGTFTGPRLTFGTQYRHLNSTGHHVDLQLKLSPILSGLAAQYIVPGDNPLTDQYTFGVNAQRFNPKNGKSLSQSVSAGYIKMFDLWKRNISVNYLHEQFKFTGGDYRNSLLLIPTLQLTRTQADDVLFTRHGSKIDFLLRGSSQYLISNTSFIQGQIKAKYIFSPTNYSRVLMRADFGYTVADNINHLPLSMQFFAGGLDSLRGFPYSYFGPGKYLKTGSLELQHLLYGNLYGAIFCDIGTADNHLNAPMGIGRGVGLIYNSAIGPIKTYVGIGKLREKPAHFDFEFSIGPDL